MDDPRDRWKNKQPLPPLRADEYRCAKCGGVFTKTVTEEECLADFAETFPKAAPVDLVMICHDCWLAIHPNRN